MVSAQKEEKERSTHTVILCYERDNFVQKEQEIEACYEMRASIFCKKCGKWAVCGVLLPDFVG